MTNTRKARELGVRAAPASGAALLALLIPKCPLCVTAWLAAFGMSAGAASVTASFARPLLLVVAAVAVARLAVASWRRRHVHAAVNCCQSRTDRQALRSN